MEVGILNILDFFTHLCLRWLTDEKIPWVDASLRDFVLYADIALRNFESVDQPLVCSFRD